VSARSVLVCYLMPCVLVDMRAAAEPHVADSMPLAVHATTTPHMLGTRWGLDLSVDDDAGEAEMIQPHWCNPACRHTCVLSTSACDVHAAPPPPKCACKLPPTREAQVKTSQALWTPSSAATVPSTASNQHFCYSTQRQRCQTFNSSSTPPPTAVPAAPASGAAGPDLSLGPTTAAADHTTAAGAGAAAAYGAPAAEAVPGEPANNAGAATNLVHGHVGLHVAACLLVGCACCMHPLRRFGRAIF
jgi:hypothetical protein